MPLLINHDMADTDSTCPVRFTTTVPTQALNMLNGQFMNDSAKEFAERLQREAGEDIRKQIKRALQIVYSRPVQEVEIDQCLVAVYDLMTKHNLKEKEAMTRFSLLALNLNEFLYID